MKCILFSATWCSPCKALSPIFEKVKANTKGVEFEKVDIDDNPELATQYGIISIPTMVFLKDGRVVDTLVGLHKEAAITAAIDGLIKKG